MDRFASRRPGSVLSWSPCIIRNARADISTQFRPEFFGNEMSIRAVADNLRTDKDDQFGPRLGFILIGKAIADTRNLIEQGNSASGAI